MGTQTTDGPDVFISYAGEDADAVARPLAAELARQGCRVWFAEYELRLGDSLRTKIDAGLASCRFGVVILSPAFFAKQWTTLELNGLAAREISEAKKIILPIWHRVGRDEVARHSPILADRVAVSTTDGLSAVARKILAVLSPVKAVFRGDQTIHDLVKINAEYWKRDRVLLDKSVLDLLFERRAEILLSGDVWLMVAESASDKRQLHRWMETVSPDVAWFALKAILLDSLSDEARGSAGELLDEQFATEQETYAETVLGFLGMEQNPKVLERSLPMLLRSARQEFCPSLTRRLLASSTHEETSLRCNLIAAICDLCPQGAAVAALGTWLEGSRYLDADVSLAIKSLGKMNDPTAKVILRKLLSEGFAGNEAQGEKYVRSLATSLAKQGMTAEEIAAAAGPFAIYL